MSLVWSFCFYFWFGDDYTIHLNTQLQSHPERVTHTDTISPVITREVPFGGTLIITGARISRLQLEPQVMSLCPYLPWIYILTMLFAMDRCSDH